MKFGTMEKTASLATKPNLLLLGFGQINSKVAQQLATEFNITSVSRTPPHSESENHLALNLISDDLSVLHPTDYLLFCLTPDTHDEKGYREAYLDSLIRVVKHFRNNPPKGLLFVSSTSVYGQNNEEEVDEKSHTKPVSFKGKILAEAEQYLQNTPLTTTTVRFSGIYGHRRTRLLEQIREGRKSASPPSGFTNRISEEDAVAVLCHLLRLTKQGTRLADCYLASDNEPTRMHEVVNWIRRQMSCQPVREDLAATRAGGKRCNNQRLRNSGYHFRHPTFREGYGDIIARQNQLRTLP